MARTRILAQVDGIVQSRSVEPGDLVQPGRTLLEIARQDSRELIVPLDEKNLAPVRLGQRAEVIADAYPAQVLAAEVSFIAPAVDSSRGTLDVHLRLLEEAAFLRQGMSVSVSIETGRREQALAIPRDALFQINGDDARVLRLRDGRVEKVQVRLGLQGAALVEALEGVQAGDQLLAVEQPASSRVRLALRPLPGTVD
jgi:HlyD family secretion protein